MDRCTWLSLVPAAALALLVPFPPGCSSARRSPLPQGGSLPPGGPLPQGGLLPQGGPLPQGGTSGRAGPDLAELARHAAEARRSILSIKVQDITWPRIRVNGKEVPREDAQKLALYRSGKAAILALKLQLATKAEIERQRQERGKDADLSAYTVTSEELRKKIDEQRQRLEREHPEMTWEEVLASQQQTEESYEWAMRTQAEFDRVFWDPDPERWPPATLIAAGEFGGKDPEKQSEFIEKFKTARKASADNQGNQIALMLWKLQIVRKLTDGIEVKDLTMGLPPDVLLAVGDASLKSADILKAGMGLGGYTEALDAIQLAAIREAVKQALVAREESEFAAAKDDAKRRRAAGEQVEEPRRPVYWLESGSPEFADALAVERARYPATPPFNHEGVVGFRRFPTMQLYNVYFQMLESFKRATEKERVAASGNGGGPLEDYVNRAKLFFSNGEVNAEVIWYSYMADPTRLSYEEGFEGARLRAERGIADIREGAGRAEKARADAKQKGLGEAEIEKAAVEAAAEHTFSKVLDRDSDFKTVDAAQKQQDPQAKPHRGRFGLKARNPLVEALHESELTTLLLGYCFSETLFYDLPVGEVLGPVRGPKGYYVGRVIARRPGAKVFDLNEKFQRQLAEEDFLNHAFQGWVNDVLSKAKIEIGP
jgi:hypothetical protein